MDTPQMALEALLKTDLHPSVRHMLKQFKYDHLPPFLQNVSKQFCALAVMIASNARTPEATVALRKLREAKDCAVIDLAMS